MRILRSMGGPFLSVALLLSIPSLFHAMTLEEAIDTALKKSPVLAIERERHLDAKEQKRLRRSTAMGRIDLVAGYTKYNLPRTLAPIVPPISPDVTSSEEISSLGVRYDVLLFNGFADLYAVKIAELGEKSAQVQMGLSRAQLIYNVESLFYRIVSFMEQKRFARAYVEALERLMQDVEAGVAAGKRAEVDRLKVAADLEDARYTLRAVDDSIETLKAKLAATIGIERIDGIEAPTGAERRMEAGDAEKSYRLQKERLQLAKSEKGLGQSRARYYPKVALSAYYGDNFGAGERVELWQVGLNLSWPIFDFGERDAHSQKARIARQIARLKLENSRLQLQSDIVDAKRRIDRAEAKLASTRRQVGYLAKVREAERVRYDRGASQIYDLLYAEAKYQKAVSERVEALYDLQMQYAYLDYITAGEQ